MENINENNENINENINEETNVVSSESKADSEVSEHEALAELADAAKDGAPVMRSDVEALARSIRRNRLRWGLAAGPAAAYLVGPSRKSLGL
ncbi:MAG: hypothetical protein DRI48_10150 [Chloroflexi bacterium]|nr:MAG: hypothetical protein DRI48_10150 [Chloroflexota bacterium]